MALRPASFVRAAALAAALAAVPLAPSHADSFDAWSVLLERAYAVAAQASDAAARLERDAAQPAAPSPVNGFGVWPQLLGRAYAVAAQASEAAARLDRTAAQPAAPGDPALHKLIAEASARFDVPEPWIRAVMRIESGGDADAVSPKGAMGLMQVMPRTYAELSARYGLGGDPYARRDNILAGSAFLREMYDRYGTAGFIAAYNAGPGRYEDCLATGRALPFETQRYVASVRLAVSQDLFGKPAAPFYEPLAISPRGELLLGGTGKPLPAADRLALHELIAQAAKRAAASK